MDAKEITILSLLVIVFGGCGIGVMIGRRDIWFVGLPFVLFAVVIAVMGVHSFNKDKKSDSSNRLLSKN